MDVLVFIFSAAFVILGLGVAGVMFRHYSPVDRPVRFSSMMEHLGLTFERTKITHYAHHLPTAARLCMHCKDAKACDAWLAGKARRVDPPDFCRNANFIRQLQKTAGGF